LSPPVTVIAGLHSISGALLTRPKPDWYLRELAGKRCLEDSIVHYWELTHFEDPFIVPDAFYEKLFDACALSYQDEPKVIYLASETRMKCRWNANPTIDLAFEEIFD
jgi:hypothetical protein